MGAVILFNYLVAEKDSKYFNKYLVASVNWLPFSPSWSFSAFLNRVFQQILIIGTSFKRFVFYIYTFFSSDWVSLFFFFLSFLYCILWSSYCHLFIVKVLLSVNNCNFSPIFTTVLLGKWLHICYNDFAPKIHSP